MSQRDPLVPLIWMVFGSVIALHCVVVSFYILFAVKIDQIMVLLKELQ